MANIASYLLCRGAKSSYGIGDDEVDLARVGLRGNVIASWESKFVAEKLIELVTLARVALEDLEERGLCASCALSTTEFEFAADMLDTLQVKHKILRPLSGSLAHRNQLSCLEVCICKRGFR